MLGVYHTPTRHTRYNLLNAVPCDSTRIDDGGANNHNAGDPPSNPGQGGPSGSNGGGSGAPPGGKARRKGPVTRSQDRGVKRRATSSSSASHRRRLSDWDSSPNALPHQAPVSRCLAPRKPSAHSTVQAPVANNQQTPTTPEGSFSDDLKNPFLDTSLQVADVFLEDIGADMRLVRVMT